MVGGRKSTAFHLKPLKVVLQPCSILSHLEEKLTVGCCSAEQE
jgi:hypothetical protein